MTETLAKIYWVDDLGELSPLASAYARARGADRMSSFGDFISLSDVCDVGYSKTDQERGFRWCDRSGLRAGGTGNSESRRKRVIIMSSRSIQTTYRHPIEHKQVFGVTFEQGRNELKIDDDLLSNIVTENKEIPESAKDRSDDCSDHTEIYTVQLCMLCQKMVRLSESVQDSSPESIVHSLAGQKADNWFLRQAPQVSESCSL